ncbi:MAG: transcription elongation factor GreA [bacterium]
MSKFPMTQEGHEQLKQELKRLRTRDRIQVAREIEAARAHGDISENAEYEAAKDKQGLLEAKIRDLESKLANAQIIDLRNMKSEKVVFGATVVLEDLDTEETLRLQIVGQDEADAKAGKISVHAPIARALIGKRIEDSVVVKTPGGTKNYEVKEILF